MAIECITAAFYENNAAAAAENESHSGQIQKWSDHDAAQNDGVLQGT